MNGFYISGPMRGRTDAENTEAFHAAERALLALGYEEEDILNPWVESVKEGLGGPIEEYLRKDLQAITTNKYDVVVLPGWTQSRGSTLEVLVALQTGRSVFRLAADGGLLKQPLTIAEVAAAHAAAESAAGNLETVLQEADRLVGGDRRATYGHPFDNFTHIGNLWSAYLSVRGVAIDIRPEDVALMMDLLKVAREANHGKRDNRVDGPGYWKCLDLIVAERKARGL